MDSSRRLGQIPPALPSVFPSKYPAAPNSAAVHAASTRVQLPSSRTPPPPRTASRCCKEPPAQTIPHRSAASLPQADTPAPLPPRDCSPAKAAPSSDANSHYQETEPPPVRAPRTLLYPATICNRLTPH